MTTPFSSLSSLLAAAALCSNFGLGGGDGGPSDVTDWGFEKVVLNLASTSPSMYQAFQWDESPSVTDPALLHTSKRMVRSRSRDPSSEPREFARSVSVSTSSAARSQQHYCYPDWALGDSSDDFGPPRRFRDGPVVGFSFSGSGGRGLGQAYSGGGGFGELTADMPFGVFGLLCQRWDCCAWWLYSSLFFFSKTSTSSLPRFCF